MDTLTPPGKSDRSILLLISVFKNLLHSTILFCKIHKVIKSWPRGRRMNYVQINRVISIPTSKRVVLLIFQALLVLNPAAVDTRRIEVSSPFPPQLWRQNIRATKPHSSPNTDFSSTQTFFSIHYSSSPSFLFSAIELVPTGGGLIGDHPIVGKWGYWITSFLSSSGFL